ncbi:MAG: hypothetical protein K8F91_18565 [Candidatus Obscuribacterales bacterium]|nr:hypothetical protein [Candidatus Obscuribacterales bacterium]
MTTKTLYVLYAGSDLEVPVARHTLKALEVLSLYAFGTGERQIDVETIFLDVEGKDFAIEPATVIAERAWLVLVFSPNFVLSRVVRDSTMAKIIDDGYGNGVRVFPVHTLPVPRRAKLPWSHINPIVIDKVGRSWLALSELELDAVNVGAPVANALAKCIELQLEQEKH